MPLSEADLNEHRESEKIVRSYKSDNSWKKEEAQSGVEWFTKVVKAPSGTDITATLSVAEVPHPAEAVVVAFVDAELRGSWDTNNKENVIIESISPVTYYFYRVTNNFPWPMSQRDMVQRTHETREADGTVIVTWKDVSHSSKPPTEQLVRSNTLWGALLLKPLSESRCEVVFSLAFDACGSIPGALLAMSAKNMPLLIRQVQTFLDNKDNFNKAIAVVERKKNARAAAGIFP